LKLKPLLLRLRGKKPKKKASIKEIFAANLKYNRRKKGLTQEKLAEMADMSLRYLAMFELGNGFPSGEMLEKLSKALDIQAFQLFYPSSTPEGAMLFLEQFILANIEKVLSTVLKQSENTPSIKIEMENLRNDIICEVKTLNETLADDITAEIKSIKQIFLEGKKK
jgi:transcriptional regulator with XRE-family HTH domain